MLLPVLAESCFHCILQSPPLIPERLREIPIRYGEALAYFPARHHVMLSTQPLVVGHCFISQSGIIRYTNQVIQIKLPKNLYLVKQSFEHEFSNIFTLRIRDV